MVGCDMKCKCGSEAYCAAQTSEFASMLVGKLLRTPLPAAAFARPPQMTVFPMSVLGDHTMNVGSDSGSAEKARAAWNPALRTWSCKHLVRKAMAL
jgi:hypothetical protein